MGQWEDEQDEENGYVSMMMMPDLKDLLLLFVPANRGLLKASHRVDMQRLTAHVRASSAVAPGLRWN